MTKYWLATLGIVAALLCLSFMPKACHEHELVTKYPCDMHAGKYRCLGQLDNFSVIEVDLSSRAGDRIRYCRYALNVSFDFGG